MKSLLQNAISRRRIYAAPWVWRSFVAFTQTNYTNDITRLDDENLEPKAKWEYAF